MSKDKTIIIIYELLLVIVFSICAFLHLVDNKILYSVIVLLLTVLLLLIVKRKRLVEKNNKISIIMAVFGILYLALFYMLGIYNEFHFSSYKFGFKTILEYIIPTIVIIISTEIIRNKLLNNDSKKSIILITIITTIIDSSIYLDAFKLKSLDNILAIIGFLLLSNLSSSILYNYISKKYGSKPIIIYKMITNLYVYIFPIVPDGYIFLRTFLRMLYPLLIYIYIDKNYNIERKIESKKTEKKEIISLTIGIIISFIMIGIISCNFLYGVLVIGSESMSNAINKGDVVFFKSTKKNIKVNDIIVFKKEDIRIVHRVIKISNINNELKYFTKGDANKTNDNWYVSENELLGKVLFKIKYIGNPSLWLRNYFDKEG